MTAIISINTWKRNRVHSNDTTLYLYAYITSWKYAFDIQNPNETGSRATSRVHLDAITEQSSVLQEESLPFGLCIVCNDKDFNGIPPITPWQLDLIPALDDPLVPRCLETVIILEEKVLQDLKECLFLAAKSPESSIQVSMAIQEKSTEGHDEIAERSFTILEFGYSLNHQKECT